MRSLFLLSSAIVFLLTSVSFSAEEAGHVLAMKNDVYRVRADKKESAKRQMKLFMQDAVETDKNARTKLYFTDDSILNLGELSRVQVETYAYSPENERSKSIYSLVEGSLKVVVGRSDLEIHTTTAVAAARGTKFIIWNETGKTVAETEVMSSAESPDIDDKDRDKSCIAVFEGTVDLMSKQPDEKKSLRVNEGNMGCVTFGLPPESSGTIDSSTKKRLAREFVVYDSFFDIDGKLAAFAPQPGKRTLGEPVIPETPPVDQLPPEGGLNGDISKMGHFNRVDDPCNPCAP